MSPPRGLRFRPPAGPLPEAAVEALRLALARRPPAPAGDVERIWEVAQRLGLAELVAPRLEAAPGTPPDLGRRLRRARLEAAARGLLHEELAREVAAVGQRLGVQLIGLKGFALVAGGYVEPERRAFQDLDLLASRDEAEAMADALVERGFERTEGPANEQHLPPLASPRGTFVDLHFRLRGVRVADDPWARAGELVASGRVERPAASAAVLWLPDREILAAHLVAHAIEQHGFRAATYPMPRLLGDLVALLPDPPAWERFHRRGAPTLAGSVSPAEIGALDSICRCLAEGRLPEAERQADGERLLRHAVAGRLDSAYARALARRHVIERIKASREAGRLGAYLRRKIGSLARPRSRFV